MALPQPKLKVKRYTALGIIGIALLTNQAVARSVYLNGQDVSSARNQYLKKVNLRIDENGNLYIEAPHYQVNEEKTYTPLSSWLKSSTPTPKHQEAGQLPEPLRQRGETVKSPFATDQAGIDSDVAQPATSEPSIANPEARLQDKPGVNEPR